MMDISGERMLKLRTDKKGDAPTWFNTKGFEMKVDEFDGVSFLSIKGKNCFLRIQKREELKKQWMVQWEIRFDESGLERVSGWRFFDNLELSWAFAPEYSYEAQKIHGKFVAWHRYLNIPCEGTGEKGDPNISVYLSNEITRCMMKLIESLF